MRDMDDIPLHIRGKAFITKREDASEVLKDPRDFGAIEETETGIYESSGYKKSLSVLESWDDNVLDITKVRTETPIVAVARAILFQAFCDIGLGEGGTNLNDWSDARSWFFSPNENFDLVTELFHIDTSWLRGMISKRRCRCGRKMLALDFCDCLTRASSRRTYKESYI